jgi:hypothetical protein
VPALSTRLIITTVEHTLRLLAGAFVTISVTLRYWVSLYWFLFTAFVALSLFESGFESQDWFPLATQRFR